MNRSRLIIQGAAETHSLSQNVRVRKCLNHNRKREKRIVMGRRSRGTGRNTEKTDCQRKYAKAPSARKKNAKSIPCLVIIPVPIVSPLLSRVGALAGDRAVCVALDMLLLRFVEVI